MKKILLSLVILPMLICVGLIAFQYLVDPGSDEPSVAVSDPAAQIARGKYLALAGDCLACHTTRGGFAYAGGRAIATPFGTVYAPNITPDVATGIGSWNAADFWRALHNGKSKDGQFLYPAFPYPNYTKISRADSDALFAYFKTLPAIRQRNVEPQLRFPYNYRVLIAAWRTLYFQPGTYQSDPRQSAQWNNGAYLVQGLGHCAACHTNRNVLGAPEPSGDLAGGLIPMQGWYAPSLSADAEAGLGSWEQQDIVGLLHNGVSPRATVFGPMALVVRDSLHYLSDDDIEAMATYLKSLPHTVTPYVDHAFVVEVSDAPALLEQGAKLYADNCAACHKDDGSGMPSAYPPLAGNRAITMSSSVNPIRMVLNGGFPPGTNGNPRPYSMPPFGPTLSDAEVAAVVSYIRSSWGNHASLVAPTTVERYRSIPIE